jgi:predicted enzyme related to lactoylglutathione lyase
MEMTVNAVSWFDIPVADFDRAKAFYSAIFDFAMPEFPMGPIRMGMLLHEQGKGVGGAIVSGGDRVPAATGTMVYLNAGRDLTTVLDRVTGAGGAVIQPKTLIAPGMGYFAILSDSEGNAVGLHSIE